ncbi:hypothetical protein RND81_13G211900 [Saponaria officinalis]|uniref:Pentatricopeptide repeat-containing protein n=1 Tax=Saponaria officinalis TaxID=3572 RepID=A0AAW1H374_SAPOF
MPEPNNVSYNAVVSGLAQHGLYKESLSFFKKMQSLYSGLFLDEFTIVIGLSSCAVFGEVELLQQLHAVVVVLRLEFDAVCNALIDAYGKCGYRRYPDLSYKAFLTYHTL